MRTILRLSVATLALLALPPTPPQPSLRATLARLPLAFEQGSDRSSYLARGAGYSLAAASGEMRLGWGGGELRLSPAGGRLSGPVPREALAGTVNYFCGRDPARWRTGIPTFARLLYAQVYPGIDLTLYGNQRSLEHDWLVAPGADPSQIALTYEGCEELTVDGEGNLVVRTGQDRLVQPPPAVYQTLHGRRSMVSGRYELRGARTVGFALGAYDATRELVIDPVVYSTYLGGTGADAGNSVALDAAGNLYVAGSTSGGFPVSGGAFQIAFGGVNDAFVTKLNATGTAVVYSTYLGGSADEAATGLAVDAAGNAYVTGTTTGGTFPTTPGAFQTVPPGAPDVFVTKLNATGTALVYSTFVGGPVFEQAGGIAVDAAGNAYGAGINRFGGFPVTGGSAQTLDGGLNDVIIFKLNPTGTGLVYATYLGGPDDEGANGIALDAASNAYVVGSSVLGSLPIFGAASQPVFGGGLRDAIVARLNAAGTAFDYSTYLGGPGDDIAQGVAVTSAGQVYVTGITTGGFPVTPGAAQPVYGGGTSDAFATSLDPTSARVFSTYLGGTLSDDGRALALDSAGNAYLTGVTSGGTFPIAGQPVQSTPQGAASEAFLTEISATGASFLYSSFFGGTGADEGRGIAVNAAGEAYLTGSADAGFPVTAGAAQPVFGGGGTDAFAARIGPELSPTPTPPPATTTNVTVQPASQSVTGAAGTTQTLTFRVVNTGDTADGYDLQVTAPASVTPNRLFLSAGNSAEVQVSVTIPASGGSGTLTVTSSSRSTIRATATFEYSVAAPARTFSASLLSGWNAVGLDVASVTSVTANPALLQRAVFVGGSYELAPVSAASLTPTTRGYWVFSTQPTTLEVSGPPATGGTVALSPGWNLAAFPGTPTNLRVFEGGSQVALGSTVLSTFYELRPDRSMAAVDMAAGGQLAAGRAYWVWALRPAELRYGPSQ